MAITDFQWQDPFLLEQQLSESDRMVRDSARAYAQRSLAPRVLECFRNGTTDRAIFREMGEVGLLGSTIAPEYGGAGLNYVAYGMIARELERIDSGFRSIASTQTSLVMLPIKEFGTLSLKQRFLPKLATGELIGCFGLSEPDHGSDPGSMVTRAVKTKGGYKLRGNKIWITNSPIADVFVVWAKEVDAKGNVGPIRGFVLERDFNRPLKKWSSESQRNRLTRLQAVARPCLQLSRAFLGPLCGPIAHFGRTDAVIHA